MEMMLQTQNLCKYFRKQKAVNNVSLNIEKGQIYGLLGQCDLLKISEEELEFMTGTKDIKEGAHKLLADYPNLKLMNVTMGKEGSIAFHEGKEVFHAPFLQKNTIETTGDRKSTRLNSSHIEESRMPSSA